MDKKPKRKTKRKRKRRDVILQRRFTILAGLTLIFLIVPWLFPPQVDHLAWQMRWRNLGLSITGLGLMPVGLWLLLTGLPAQEAHTLSPGLIATIAVFPAAIWGIGWILRVLWNSVLSVKLYVGVLLAGNLLCGWVVANLEGMHVEAPITCERALTDNLSLRTVSYRVARGTLGDPSFRNHYLFFLTSDDGGQSWDQMFFTEHGVRSDWLCPNIHTLDGTMFWSWARAYIVISLDGGRSWFYSLPCAEWDRAIIRDVAFMDRMTGTAIVDVYPYSDYAYDVAPDETITYHTTDGGRTWTRAE